MKIKNNRIMLAIKRNSFSTALNVVKKGTVATLCMVMIGLLAVGCKKDDGKTPQEPTYPTDIPFTEYSLAETCQWTNLAYDNTVIVINNDEKLSQYVACIGGGYPEIDFEKQALLLASGATGGIAEFAVKELQQISENEYELNIEILLDGTKILQNWNVALVVEKMSENSNLELNVTIDEPNPFTGIIGSIKVIPENISIYDSVFFVMYAPPFGGGCSHQFNVDSIIATKVYISGKYDSNRKCGELWDKEVNDTINIGLFPAGTYKLTYTFIDINPYGSVYPTERYNIKFVVSKL
jgi:hypothetical protein